MGINKQTKDKLNEFKLDLKTNEDEVSVEKRAKKAKGFGDILTFQSIWCVIIVIVMVLGHTFIPQKFNSMYVTFKNLISSDFSFKDSFYESVGNFITVLNQFTPHEVKAEPSESGEELDGVGGEENPVEPKVVPRNATFAPIINTGTATFPISDEYRITSEFGFRIHPITQKDDFHNALDIAAKEGTSIKSVANGIVKTVASDASLGEYIVIDHQNGFVSKYAHCSRIIAKEGMKIREGEVIAKVGATGATTGPHLHFATVKNAMYFNPMNLFERNLL